MARQEIDLYTAELRPKADYLSARYLGPAFLILLFLVGIRLGFSAWSVSRLEGEVARARTALEAGRTQSEALRAQLPVSQAASLDQTIAEIEQRIAARDSVKQLFLGSSVGNAAGFSAALVELARQSSAEFSLDHFALVEGGRRVWLDGHARSADVVPAYVDALLRTSAFRSSEFGELTIDREEDQTNGLRFSIGKGERGHE